MAGLWSELEQEPYDPEEFVERLAWRATNASGGGGSAAPSDDLDAGQLHEAFVLAIKDLTLMHEKQKKKCQQLEQVQTSLIQNTFNYRKTNLMYTSMELQFTKCCI